VGAARAACNISSIAIAVSSEYGRCMWSHGCHHVGVSVAGGESTIASDCCVQNPENRPKSTRNIGPLAYHERRGAQHGRSQLVPPFVCAGAVDWQQLTLVGGAAVD
jgi:hypothetical protein